MVSAYWFRSKIVLLKYGVESYLGFKSQQTTLFIFAMLRFLPNAYLTTLNRTREMMTNLKWRLVRIDEKSTIRAMQAACNNDVSAFSRNTWVGRLQFLCYDWYMFLTLEGRDRLEVGRTLKDIREWR